MKKATRRLALWRADLDGGVCAAPEECVEVLRDRGPISLVLEHQAYGMTPATRTFETALRQDIEWQFGDIVWPDEVRPGVFATVSWQAGRPDEVVVRTTAMEEPIRVDGVDYFHEYDPRVVTREFEAGTSNRGQVLYAVRKHGRVFDDGSAVLAEAGLAARTGLGRGSRGTFLLRNALDQLIREGYLTRVTGSLDASGYPAYPAVGGQKTADMLFYAPMVEPAPYPGEEEAGREYWVSGFVRKLPRGAQPSERQVALHEQVTETELEPGYTFVKKHRRNT
ncbi:hypothetical protein HH310_00155 [Actinoplanes sp. TBRC 11911]|uniref:hypothetical protein n=1 Tax=Actinoplanes sp. TBRC 11911 TaxID=2729386 RepID=UPI00145FB21D|nr:hypothetical protein [Actinoplanes sp. TBRC 11911]NMO49616.1 hypothetical protein [Actinoplanes sp. TBRC 11911]